MLLKEKRCKPCSGQTEMLTSGKVEELLGQLKNGWEANENKNIKKDFHFENFRQGMAFAQEVGKIAEQEGHHPDICIHYKYVEIELSTHAINGLSENDFILASKIDEL